MFVVCLVCVLGIYILFVTTSSRDQFKMLATDNKELKTWTLRPKDRTKGFNITRSLNTVNHADEFNATESSKKLIAADNKELKTWTLRSKDHTKGFNITRSLNTVNHADESNATESSKKLIAADNKELKTWTLRSKDHTKGFNITRSLNTVNHTSKLKARKSSKTFKGNSTRKRECSKKLPTVLIIGAPKCGTGALSAFLRYHPYIKLYPNIELNYFSQHYDLGTNWYKDQMPCSYPSQLTIERSTEYLCREGVPEKVRKMNKKMKLLLSVCEPVKRTISNFAMFQANGFLPRNITLGEYLLNYTSKAGLEPASWYLHILVASIYSRQFSSWRRYFPLKQFHIVDGDNLSRDPFEEISAVESFLGLRNYTKKEDFIYNKTKGFFCYKKAVGEPYCLPPGKGREHPTIGESVALLLKKFYQPFNLIFYRLSRRVFDW